jgi:phosphonate transport system substrate-binding protein
MSHFKFLLLLLAVLTVACSEQGSVGEKPDVIRVGVLPDQEASVLQKKFHPLLSYLQEQTGFKYELVIPGSYSNLLQLFKEGKLEMAYFGAVTFLKAHDAVGAEALVTRDVDNRFTSVIVIPADSEAKSLQDLKGKRFSFASSLSTSGHYMPRYFLLENGIDPEEFFLEVLYSSTHDKAAYMVQDGKVDAAVLNAVIYKIMLEDGRLDKNRIKLLWESPPYQDYAWAVQTSISNRVKISIRDAFLNLSKDVETHKKVLEAIGANYFLPLKVENFDKLKSALNRVGSR